ncbi:Mucolipin-3 [Sarcoptes scabiei]|nr:Mucolipin-3 [Sarcoptes scabiei]
MSTVEDQIRIISLRKEFPDVNVECLKDVLGHLENDLERCQDFLRELFNDDRSSMINDVHNETIHSEGEGSTISKQQIFLPIIPSFFDDLDYLFNSRVLSGSRKKPEQLLSNEFKINESIYLPIDHSLAYDIYQTLLNHLDFYCEPKSSFEYIPNETDLIAEMIGNEDPIEKDCNINEIMETEQALKQSREDYLKSLIQRKRFCIENRIHDDALIQEWMIEKKRDFLIKNFPGIDLIKLNKLFEINFFDISETVKDIEALYDCRLPLYYNKSLYSDQVKKPKPEPSDSFASSSEIVNRLESMMIDETEREFRATIKNLFHRRNNLYIKINHLKLKKIRFIYNGNQNLVFIYEKEIQKCYHDLQLLSDDIIDAFQNHSFPENQIDFHGLQLNEVRIILPWILDFKQDQLRSKESSSLMIITGHGNNMKGCPIRRYVGDYLAKKSFKFRPDNRGRFEVTLHQQLLNESR